MIFLLLTLLSATVFLLRKELLLRRAERDFNDRLQRFSAHVILL